MYLKFSHMLSFNQSSIPRSYVRVGWFSGTQFMFGANSQRQCRKYHYAAGWKDTDRVLEGWGKGPTAVLEMEFVSVTNQQIIRADVCVWHFASCHVLFSLFFVCSSVSPCLNHNSGKHSLFKFCKGRKIDFKSGTDLKILYWGCCLIVLNLKLMLGVNFV